MSVVVPLKLTVPLSMMKNYKGALLINLIQEAEGYLKGFPAESDIHMLDR